MTTLTAGSRRTAPAWMLRTLGALAVILVLRLVALRLTGLELAYDEAQYWAWSRDFAFGYFTKPGLIAWLIGATTAVCGDSATCVRVSAPILHVLSGFVLFLLGSRLYDERVGFFAAVGWALMPAVALSSLLITTDVPLLFFWSLALFATVMLWRRSGPGAAVLLGLATALGLNAKYAMIYLPVATILWAAATPSARFLLRDRWFRIGTLLGLTGFLPNLIWNVQNDFVTFRHTGDNTGWSELGFSLGRPFEFIAGQFAIPGPILLAVAFVMLFRRIRTDRPDADGFLLWHSMPVILVIFLNATVAKMHGNWAAAAYPAIVVLATAWLVRGARSRLLAASVGISLIASLVVAVGSAMVGHMELRDVPSQIERLQGWRDFGTKVSALARSEGIATVVTVGRPMTSEMIYGLRETGLEVKAFRPAGAGPTDHFEMTRPWTPGNAGPVLLVTTEDPASLGFAVAPRRVGDIPSSIYLAQDGFVPAYRVDP